MPFKEIKTGKCKGKYLKIKPKKKIIKKASKKVKSSSEPIKVDISFKPTKLGNTTLHIPTTKTTKTTQTTPTSKTAKTTQTLDSVTDEMVERRKQKSLGDILPEVDKKRREQRNRINDAQKLLSDATEALENVEDNEPIDIPLSDETQVTADDLTGRLYRLQADNEAKVIPLSDEAKVIQNLTDELAGRTTEAQMVMSPEELEDVMAGSIGDIEMTKHQLNIKEPETTTERIIRETKERSGLTQEAFDRELEKKVEKAKKGIIKQAQQEASDRELEVRHEGTGPEEPVPVPEEPVPVPEEPAPEIGFKDVYGPDDLGYNDLPTGWVKYVLPTQTNPFLELQEALKTAEPTPTQEGKGILDDPTDNVQLANLMKRHPEFVGVFPIDRIPTRINKKKYVMIINLDPASLPGSHWVSLFVDTEDDKEINYMDSLGDPAPIEVMTALKELTDRIPYMLKFKQNSVKLQSDDTSTCGIHAVNFLKKRLGGMSFADATQFSKVNDLNPKILQENELKNNFGHL